MQSRNRPLAARARAHPARGLAAICLLLAVLLLTFSVQPIVAAASDAATTGQGATAPDEEDTRPISDGDQTEPVTEGERPDGNTVETEPDDDGEQPDDGAGEPDAGEDSPSDEDTDGDDLDPGDAAEPPANDEVRPDDASGATTDDDPDLHGAPETTDADRAGTDRPIVLDRGHIDAFEVTYDTDSDQLVLLLKDDTRIHDPGIVFRDPHDVTIAYLDERAIDALPAAEGQWAFLGPYGGTDAWIASQSGGDQGYIPWSGWSTERLQSSLTDTGIEPAPGESVSLDIAITGPGDVFTFMTDSFGGVINRYIDTFAGGADVIPVTANAHVHTNWVFTDTGDYRLVVTPTLETVDHGTITGPSADYHVRVGDGDDSASDDDDGDDGGDGDDDNADTDSGDGEADDADGDTDSGDGEADDADGDTDSGDGEADSGDADSDGDGDDSDGDPDADDDNAAADDDSDGGGSEDSGAGPGAPGGGGGSGGGSGGGGSTPPLPNTGLGGGMLLGALVAIGTGAVLAPWPRRRVTRR